MRIWGKLLGLVFGFMFARWPGAILGFIIGHLFDRGYSRAFDQVGGFSRLLNNANSVKNRALFFHTLFSIMGHIAKSSGRVTEADIALASALMTRLGLSKELKQEAQAAYTEGKQADFPIKQTVKEFRRFCSGRAEFMQMYLELQIQAALVNGALHDKARQILTTVAKSLGYSQAELDSIIRQLQAANRFHQQRTEQANGHSNNHNGHRNRQRQDRQSSVNRVNQLANAYAILGISESADEKSAKKAYKKLMSQHHPDKLAAQGLPEQAMLVAKERAQDIQGAWEMIKQNKGWR